MLKFPRKLKKAFKQIKTAPRIGGEGLGAYIQYGKLIVPKRKTKYILKAIKFLKAKEMILLRNMMTNKLSECYSEKMVVPEIKNFEFEWEVKVK